MNLLSKGSFYRTQVPRAVVVGFVLLGFLKMYNYKLLGTQQA